MVKGVGTLTGYFTVCCFFLELQQKTFFNVVNFPPHNYELQFELNHRFTEVLQTPLRHHFGCVTIRVTM